MITKIFKKHFSAQVFLVTVFIISIAMFSSLLALSPIRTKIIQIKEMEYVYQAMGNAEKALEVGTYIANYGPDTIPLPSIATDSTEYQGTTTCAYYATTALGTCTIISVKAGDGSFERKAYVMEVNNYPAFNVSFYNGYVRNISRGLIEK